MKGDISSHMSINSYNVCFILYTSIIQSACTRPHYYSMQYGVFGYNHAIGVTMHSLVSGRCYEVDAAVDTAVWDVLLAFNANLLIQVQLKLVIDVVQHRLPTVHTHKQTNEYTRPHAVWIVQYSYH